MPTRLDCLVIDANDPSALARFWAAAIGWPVSFEEPDEVVVEPDDAAEGQALVFVPVPERKTVKNRVHIDLGTTSAEHQAELVARLRSLGAAETDIGQRDVDWIVLADPEGNEFCVLAHEDRYDGRAPAAIVVDAHDPAALARFWAPAIGWELAIDEDGWAELSPPDARSPLLGFLSVPEPKTVKNRLHLDVRPDAGEDHAEAVATLEAAGATRVEGGQGEVDWVVLADPDGNEFCILTPR